MTDALDRAIRDLMELKGYLEQYENQDASHQIDDEVVENLTDGIMQGVRQHNDEVRYLKKH